MKNFAQSDNAISLTGHSRPLPPATACLIGSIPGAATEAGAGDAIGRMRPNAASDRRYIWNA